jgi:hypothetical protein
MVLPRLLLTLAHTSAHGARYVKARMEFQVPMHPEWGVTIERVSPINGGVRRALHDLIGGYPDLANAEDASYWYATRLEESEM